MLTSVVRLVSIANYIRQEMSTKKVRPNESVPQFRGSGLEARGLPSEAISIADSLHSAAIHLLRRVRKQDVASGQGPARLSALSVLVFAGPKTLGELAAAEQVKPPTMSRIVSGLAREHLVETASDPTDARRMRIRATDRGKSILLEGKARRIAHLAAHLERLTTQELKAIGEAAEILGRLLRQWD